jgi:hypothetical protein
VVRRFGASRSGIWGSAPALGAHRWRCRPGRLRPPTPTPHPLSPSPQAGPSPSPRDHIRHFRGDGPSARNILVAHATDAIALHERDDLTWIGSTAKAAEDAYKQARIGPGDLSFCEVHDCFTIAEIMVIERSGWWIAARAGRRPNPA